MIQPSPKEWTRSTRAGDVNCDLLHARFIDHSYDRHIHCGYAIGVITHGVESFWCNGSTYHAPAGSIVTVNPYEVHDGSPGIEEGFAYRMFYFSPEDYVDVLGGNDGKPVIAPHFTNAVINDPELSRQLAGLHNILQNEPDGLLRHENWIEVLTQLALRHADLPPSAIHCRSDLPAARKMREYLHDNLSAGASLEQLGQITGLSPFQALRQFKANYGMTPHRYLTNIRLFKAQGLLMEGVPLADAAFASGFSDQAHLTRWYKRIYGITPGKYAAACNNVQYFQSPTT